MAIWSIWNYLAWSVTDATMRGALTNVKQLTEARTSGGAETVKWAVAATSGQVETGKNAGSVEAISDAVKAAAAEQTAKMAYGSTGTFSKPVGTTINTSA